MPSAGQHQHIVRLAYTARLKVKKNKNEQEEPWDVENQKNGHSLERKKIFEEFDFF